MKQLLEDYRRRLKTLNEELRITIDEATDTTKINRLVIKRGCYRTFISELERIVPADKPIDPKIIAEENRVKEEREADYDKKTTDFINNVLMKDEPEIQKPKGFEDFEPSTGQD